MKKITTIEALNIADSYTVTLSKNGIEKLKDIVDTYANFELNVDDKRQLEALSSDDHGFDEDGYINMELSGHQTKSGNPYTYSVRLDVDLDVYDTSKEWK